MTSELLASSWKLDLWVAIPLAVGSFVYLRGLLQMRKRQWYEIGAFAGGWTILVLALLSPMATISDVLFSMHMTQHEVLMLIAAPLLTLGRPVVPMLWALPSRMRRSRHLSAVASQIGAATTAPFLVFMLHMVTLWAWHLPSLYQAAVIDSRVHAIQHVMLTGTACLFWWGLLRGRYGKLGYGTAVFYVFATALHSGGLGALLTMASQPLYHIYIERHPLGVDPLADQQIAGLLMWIPSGVVLTLIGVALFAAWLGEAERRRRLVISVDSASPDSS